MNAPIVLFTYNRIEHLTNVFLALEENEMARESKLFVFSDGAKDKKDEVQVNIVRKYLQRKKQNSLFESLEIIESPNNKGVAASVILGVSKIIEEYGKVIVIEDDIVISSDFLRFMNDALNYYQNDKKIWSIGGWNVLHNTEIDKDVFFTYRICSCAWATWIDRWQETDWNVKSYRKFKHNWRERKRFNLYGNDRTIMLDEQMSGLIDSWAIRFDYAGFVKNRATVMPKISRAINDGYDGSGTHCGKRNIRFAMKLNNKNEQCQFYHYKDTDNNVQKQYKAVYDSSYVYAIARWVKLKLHYRGSIRNILKR